LRLVLRLRSNHGGHYRVKSLVSMVSIWELGPEGLMFLKLFPSRLLRIEHADKLLALVAGPRGIDDPGVIVNASYGEKWKGWPALVAPAD
jgi:hypothetical protein